MKKILKNLNKLKTSLKKVIKKLNKRKEKCWKKRNKKIIWEKKKKSVSDLNSIINDLQSLQRERIGLEIGAWRA